MKDSRCPICQAESSKELYSMTISRATEEVSSDLSLDRKNKLKDILHSLWKQDDCSFYQCSNCGYGFVTPYISGNAEYYSALYYKEFTYPKTKWEYQKSLDIIQGSDNLEQKKVLEIGAGNGAFLDLISQKGIKREKIFATEYSKPACDKINSKGYFATQETFSELIKNKMIPQVDFVCMYQVLEHMDNVHEAFEFINSHTTKDANLFIAVPNERLRGMLDKYGIHLDIPPTHVGKFSVTTFEFLAKKYGWKVSSYAFEQVSYPSKIKKLLFFLYLKGKINFEKSTNKLYRLTRRYLRFLYLIMRHLKPLIQLQRPNYGTSFWINLVKE